MPYCNRNDSYIPLCCNILECTHTVLNPICDVHLPVCLSPYVLGCTLICLSICIGMHICMLELYMYWDVRTYVCMPEPTCINIRAVITWYTALPTTSWWVKRVGSLVHLIKRIIIFSPVPKKLIIVSKI